MFEFYNKMGLESNTDIGTEAKDLVDIELDILGCEAMSDLFVGQLDHTLESEIIAIEFNRLILSEIASGIPNAVMSSIENEIGLEGVKETIDYGIEKIKKVITLFTNMFMQLIKKLKALIAVSDKVFLKVNKKAKELKAKLANLKVDDKTDKKIKSSMESYNEIIDHLCETFDGTEEILGYFLEMYDDPYPELFLKCLDELHKDTEYLDLFTKLKEINSKEDKSIKKRFSEIEKQINDNIEEITYPSMKSKSTQVITSLEHSSNVLSNFKLIKKIDEFSAKQAKVKNELSKEGSGKIAEVINKEGFSKEVILKVLQLQISAINGMAMDIVMNTKIYVKIANLAFKDIDKFIAM